MRRTTRLDSKLSFSPEAMLNHRIRALEHDYLAEEQSADQQLDPKCAIKRAILDRFAYMIR